jgi:hypothetical protein
MFWSARGGAGVALAIASLVAVFSVPRPEFPDAIPYPPVDTERTNAEFAGAQAEVEKVLASPLSAEVRGVGERVRRCGLLEVSDPQSSFAFERAKLREVVLHLLQQNRGADLVRLRELQSALLRMELVAKWSGQQRDDGDLALAELGANLPSHLEASRSWFVADRYFEQTLRALFVERWGNLVGFARHPELAPTANDWRLIHRFRTLRLLGLGQVDGQELRSVLADVAKYSPEYPIDYASGIAFYRTGAFADAVDAFGRHLASHPTSEWAVRAQNFRLEAARALVE